jgi:hypothetical protein
MNTTSASATGPAPTGASAEPAVPPEAAAPTNGQPAVPSVAAPTSSGRGSVHGDGSGVRGRSGWLPDVLVDGPAASCDVLVELVDTLRQIDRLTAKATDLVARAHTTGEVEDATGLPLELWLSAAGRRTRSDRRMLQSVAELRSKLPSLAEGFDAGKVSWAQVRAVVCACVKLPDQLLGSVDEALAGEIEVLADADPDALVHVVSQATRSLEDGPDAEHAAAEVRERFLAIQPRLDGTGGSIYGEADAYGLAVLSEALDAGTPPPDVRVRDQIGERNSDETRRAQVRAQQGRRRMDALIAMAERSLFSGAQPGRDVRRGHGATATGTPDTARDDDGRGQTGHPTGGVRPTPTLLVTMSYETLIGASNDPASLLTTLTGGRMKVAADTARRLVDEAGATIRTIVLEDTGQILGVGRKNYQPPGWLRDALLVRDQTCRAPHCLTAARRCDLDHADPWTAVPGPDGRTVGGPTDIINLAHLCRTDHGAKDRDGWHVYGLTRGRQRGLHRWTHRRTGLTIDTAPAARRLPLPTAQPTPRAGPAPPTGHARATNAPPRAGPAP